MARTEKDADIISLARELPNTLRSDDYEKMISGMLYDPTKPELLEARHRARCLAYEFNSLDPRTLSYDEAAKKRLEILGRLLGRVGEGTFIEPPFMPDYGCNVIIGKNCFANFNLTILDTSLVIIGDRVMMGPNVSIYGAGHETSVLSRIKLVEFGLPVRIEDDCWIGGKVIILPGVTIGKGCTVGAGSVVTKSIPPYSVAIGSPAKIVKKLPTVEEERNDPKNPYVHFPDLL